MALSTKVGSLTKPTVTGNQAITGVGFTPKGIIFIYNYRTADGTASDDVIGMGVATSSTNRQAESGAGQSDNRYKRRATKAITMYNGSGNPLFEADLVSMDSDGFTLNWSTVTANSEIINYIAIGGSDVTNTGYLGFSNPASTGNASYTGMGFKPDALLVFSNHEALSTTGINYYYFEIGAGISSSSRWATSSFSGHAAYTNGASKASVTNKILRQADIISGENIFGEADLVSLDTDGFTLNYTKTATEDNVSFGMKGGKYATGSLTQPSSTGNQSVTGLGFQPTGVMFFSVCNASNNTDTTPYMRSEGATDGTNQFNIWTGNDQTHSDQDLDRTKCIKIMTIGASVTTNGAASIVSLDSDGFTIDWTTTDATGASIYYLAFGSNAVTSHFLSLMGVGT